MDIKDRFRLDVPVGQAGMGGGLAGATLAAAVAEAGGLGTIGIATPRQLRTSIDVVRERAPGRAVAVNLLMPFVRRHHVAVCVEAQVDVVALAFGEKRRLVEHLRDAGIFVFVMVGTPAQARAAVAWDADGLIAQGREAGGHLVGTMPALDFLPHAVAAAGKRPVFLAGGIATGADTRPGRGSQRRHRRYAIPVDARGRRKPRISATSHPRRQDHRNKPVRFQLAAAPPRGAQCRHSAMV
jgi:nitronate monooxygenase